MNHYKVTLYWDLIPIASTIITTDLLPDEDRLEEWNRIDLRLTPEPEAMDPNVVFQLWQSTYLRLQFERVDALGRRLTR